MQIDQVEIDLPSNGQWCHQRVPEKCLHPINFGTYWSHEKRRSSSWRWHNAALVQRPLLSLGLHLCSPSVAASHLSKGRQEGSSVATAKEAIKRQHYNDIPSCYILEVVNIETLGGIGDSSWAFLRTLGQRIQEQTGEKRSFAWLRQRLSIEVERGNAACILESVPD